MAAVKPIPQRMLYPVYEARLMRELDGMPQPRHLAVMCDGNRRWARECGFEDVSHGHRVGAKKIGELVRWCRDTEVEIVTVYLLSTENLSRSREELTALLPIIADVVGELARKENDCRIRLVGRLELLPDVIVERLQRAADATSHKDGIEVNIAVGYGGRQEIVDAVRRLLKEKVAAGHSAEELPELVTADAISEHVYTSGQPDPDLVIRTSGEQRLSGFLLWQSAYSEIWFTDTYWPAFRRVDFLRALRAYLKRSRRFGK